MIERALSKYKLLKWDFLRRVHGVTLSDKVRSCEIRKTLNVSHFCEKLALSFVVSAMCPECSKKDWPLAGQVLLATPT